MTTMAKLKITPKEGPKQQSIEVPFNPNNYTIQKSVTWTTPGGKADSAEAQTNARQNAPPLTFGGGQARTLSLDLLFDVTEETIDAKRDVRYQTKQVTSLSRIVRDLNPPRPPVCEISWGKAPSTPGTDFPFTGVISQITEKFVLFLPDGRPIRANLTVQFTESLDPKVDALLTDPEFTTRLCKRGDSLSSIAGEVYNDPTLWRVIAEANSLDNPRKLAVGLRLNIPKLR